MATKRQQIAELLTGGEHDVRQLSQAVGIQEKEVYTHLEHIRRSAVPRKQKLNVHPARCRDCGYVFTDRRRLSRPSRCPRCKSEFIGPPSYRLRKM